MRRTAGYVRSELVVFFILVGLDLREKDWEWHFWPSLSSLARLEKEGGEGVGTAGYVEPFCSITCALGFSLV